MCRSAGHTHHGDRRELDDRALVEAFCGGDADALGELYLRYRPAALRWIRRIAGDPTIAEDDLHEAFIRIARELCASSPLAFRAWLWRVVRNMAIDRRRAAARKPECSLEESQAAAEVTLPAIADPQEWVEIRGDVRTIGVAAGRLPSHYQHAIALAHVVGCDAAEIGVRLGVSASAATKLVTRARERLIAEYRSLTQ